MPPIKRQQPLQINQVDRWYDPRDLAEKMKQPEAVKCECGCPYMEQVAVQQFPKMHNVILGQAVQPIQDFAFYIFRCLKCGEIYEPQVQLAARDSARKAYEDFLDEMERPFPVKDKPDPEIV